MATRPSMVAPLDAGRRHGLRPGQLLAEGLQARHHPPLFVLTVAQRLLFQCQGLHLHNRVPHALHQPPVVVGLNTTQRKAQIGGDLP